MFLSCFCRFFVLICIYPKSIAPQFLKSAIYDLSGNPAEALLPFKPFSDRMDSTVFYGFSVDSRMFISVDSGKHFYECAKPTDFPCMILAHIDCADHSEIRGDAGKSGIFYMAMNTHGLWKLFCDTALAKEKIGKEDVSSLPIFTAHKLSRGQDCIKRIGLGLPHRAADYLGCQKTLYLNGNIAGQYGFYKSEDDGKTYERINDANQMFGEILSIDGDSQVPGRFYLATGSRGLIMGEPADGLH